jgi:hypothetical protein
VGNLVIDMVGDSIGGLVYGVIDTQIECFVDCRAVEVSDDQDQQKEDFHITKIRLIISLGKVYSQEK